MKAGGEAAAPVAIDLHRLAKRQRREVARKKDADMVTWDVVEQTSKWASLLQEGSSRKRQIQVEEITSSVESPPPKQPQKARPELARLDLLAPLTVPLSISSSTLLDVAGSGQAVDAPDRRLAEPPTPPTARGQGDQLHLPVPTFLVRTEEEAHSAHLQAAVHSVPTAVLPGLASAVGMRLGRFSTRSLAETAPEQRVEVRTQRRMPPHLNLDPATGQPVWFCKSSRSHKTMAEFAAYQAASHLDAMESRVFKRPRASHSSTDSDPAAITDPYPEIHFGTNIDLSDPKVWGAQLGEISKLPAFLTLHGPANLLSHMGHEVLGMNTVQLYIKVPGCRTPGHQENLNFASVNVNIGPGDCVWVVVGNEWWGALETMCRSRGMSYLSGSWWPNVADLKDARIPYYLFKQRAGETVFIAPGAVHWVQAEGHCVNIAWNTGVLSGAQWDLATQRYEWNKRQKYKSIVPVQHLAWRLARNLLANRKAEIRDERLRRGLVSVLLKSLNFQGRCVALLKRLDLPTQDHPWTKGDPAPYCKRCDEEVFNVLLVSADEAGENWVWCFHCALRQSADLSGFAPLLQFPLQKLAQTLDLFRKRNPCPNGLKAEMGIR